MSNTFDMINNALMRELERLDDINPATEAGRAELARAKTVREVCAAGIDNANATVNAMSMLHRVTKNGISLSSMPALMGVRDEQ